MDDSRSIPPLGVRLPPGLKADIKNLAIRNRRSMNAEIVTILERAVRTQSLETKMGTEAAA